uniref:Ovule protein n=1 Tax=Parastrongyloides trichosuri TaxID=131310 RepID=A0A0N4Z1C9_PARTI
MFTHHLSPLIHFNLKLTINLITRLFISHEPILFPKLRIYFADFPYLHYFIDQRLDILETCCGYGYGCITKFIMLSLTF